MTKKFPRLIQEFLVPALDNGTYGDNLKWIDKEEGLFSLSWNHKNSAQWNEEDAAVFVDWDKLKGHYDPSEGTYYMKAKQRFRSALYKLDIVEEIPCKQKNKRLYKLHLDEDRSKPRKPVERVSSPKERGARKKTKVPVKKESEVKEELFPEESSSSSSGFSSSQKSTSSASSESIDYNKVEEKKEDLCSLKRTLEMPNEEPNPAKVRKVPTTPSVPCPSTVLKESTRTNIVYARRQAPVQIEYESKKSVFVEEHENICKNLFHNKPEKVDRFANRTVILEQKIMEPLTESPLMFVTEIW